jgi:hypothetical protein
LREQEDLPWRSRRQGGLEIDSEGVDVDVEGAEKMVEGSWASYDGGGPGQGSVYERENWKEKEKGHGGFWRRRQRTHGK